MSKPPYVIRPDDAEEACRLRRVLTEYTANNASLEGLDEVTSRVLVHQIIDSLRRVRVMEHWRDGRIASSVLDPLSTSFHPQKGAVLRAREMRLNDAFWLVFLSTHFGRDPFKKWSLTAAVYGSLGQGMIWDWERVCGQTEEFGRWLEGSEEGLRRVGARFGNHRKFQSLCTSRERGTGAAILTYIDWIGESHQVRFDEICEGIESPQERFAMIFDALGAVAEFGRVARFDYLASAKKLGFLAVEADSLHLAGSTGPLRGARLLVCGDRGAKMAPRDLEMLMASFGIALGVSFDVLEDALCNWQKSPRVYVPFRG